MSSFSEPQIKRGDRVRHRDGTVGEVMAPPSGGAFQAKTEKGVIVTWSVHDVTVIDET